MSFLPSPPLSELSVTMPAGRSVLFSLCLFVVLIGGGGDSLPSTNKRGRGGKKHRDYLITLGKHIPCIQPEASVNQPVDPPHPIILVI